MNALAIEKQQIYKLAARHRVPRCELVYLLFLKEILKMCKPLNILTQFYEYLLNPRSVIFEKEKKNLFETFA